MKIFAGGRRSAGFYRRHNVGPDMVQHMTKIDGIWHCSTCLTKFRDKTDLRRHVEAKHLSNVLYRCNLCSFSTKTSYYFRKHQLMHEREHSLTPTALAVDLPEGMGHEMGHEDLGQNMGQDMAQELGPLPLDLPEPDLGNH